MTLDDQICYRAVAARDARFDGIFFVGVTTTGIYCRPSRRASVRVCGAGPNSRPATRRLTPSDGLPGTQRRAFKQAH